MFANFDERKKGLLTVSRADRLGGEVVLCTRTGGLWAWEEMLPGGKLRCSDKIETNYDRLTNSSKMKIDKPLYPIRRGTAVFHWLASVFPCSACGS